MSFETIGEASQRAAQSLTGRQPGAITSADGRDAARKWLEERSPEEVDKALLTSLRSSLGVAMQPEVQFRYPQEGGYYSVTVGIELWGKSENFQLAADKIRLAMEPAESERIEEWLALLQAATAGARRSEEGAIVSLSLYAGALRRYPADVAKAACEKLATTVKWFPVLADVLETCERMVGTRRMMLFKLERASR